MNRHPRDPFDPFDNDNNSQRGGFDPFNDPFFQQFEQIHQRMFRDFFGDDDRPAIFIQHPNSSKTQTPNNNNAPDLSQINPNAPQTKNHQKNNNYSNTAPSFFRMFDHFFEPEYDDHKLSDINPNLSDIDNGPIMNNECDNKGLIHPNGTPPGFRSPYLPNSTGAEKKMEFGNENDSFFRSKSVVISTGPDGKTTKTTTIRDSNGVTTNTEQFDANDNNNGYNNGNDIRSIFNWASNVVNDDVNDRIELFPNQKQGYPLFKRTHDPFEGFRSKWQNWKWNPSNWYNGSGDKPNDSGNDNGYRNRNLNNNINTDYNKSRNEGIKWQSYRDYKHENKAPSLLDDIVKKNDE